MIRIFVICWISCLPFINYSQYNKIDTLSYLTLEEALLKKPEEVIALDLSKSKLTEVPDTVQLFVNLQGIKLTKNKLTALPDFFKSFHQLKYVHLSKNNFNHFPHVLFYCTTIQLIDISRNKVGTISPGIKNLSELTHLDIWDNEITDFPEELTLLKKLVFIDARGITFAPSFIEKWEKKLPSTKIQFDPPCNCLE